jgi:hypothetical protein
MGFKRDIARERKVIAMYLAGMPIAMIPAPPAYLHRARQRMGVPPRPRGMRPLKRERVPKAYPVLRDCAREGCERLILRHELDTDRTYASREVCSRACMRALKGTQAERGAMRWRNEEARA